MEAEKLEELPGLTLREAMAQIDEEEIVSVGSDAAYFFIGIPKEYREDEEIIDRDLRKEHLIFAKSEEGFLPAGDRAVSDAYERCLPGDGLILIVPGVEHGRFWVREEYERWRTAKSRLSIMDDDTDCEEE